MPVPFFWNEAIMTCQSIMSATPSNGMISKSMATSKRGIACCAISAIDASAPSRPYSAMSPISKPNWRWSGPWRAAADTAEMQRHQTLTRAASFCEILNLRALILMAPMAGACPGKELIQPQRDALPLVPRGKLITQQPYLQSFVSAVSGRDRPVQAQRRAMPGLGRRSRKRPAA